MWGHEHLINSEPLTVILDLNKVVVIERRAKIPERIACDYKAVRHTDISALRRAESAKQQKNSKTLKALPDHRGDYTHWIAEESRKVQAPVQ
jgi:hypothetical protein